MAIISRIGSKSLKVRALYFGMYVFLILGSLTMVYPFMLMVAGSTKSAVDMKFMRPVPRFFYEDAWLYRKHVEALFNDRLTALNPAYDMDEVSFETLLPPGLDIRVAEAVAAEEAAVKAREDAGQPGDARSRSEIIEELSPAWEAGEGLRPEIVKVANDFLNQADLPPYWHTIGYLEASVSRTIPMNLRNFKNWLREQYGKDINEVNRAIGSEFIEWNWIAIAAEEYLQRRQTPRDTTFQNVLDEYKEQVDRGLHYYFSAEGYYKKMYLKVQYGLEIEAYNQDHGTSYSSWDDVHLARTLPEREKEAEDWIQFVRNTLALQYIRANEAATPLYRDFLRAKHLTIANLNKNYETNYASFADIPLVEEPPTQGMALSDWESFLSGWSDPEDPEAKQHQLPADMIYIRSLETRYQDYLLERFGTLEAINDELGTDYATLADITFPQKQLHYSYFVENKGLLKKEFITRNYKTVAEYMLFHGRGIFNTVVYCLLAIMAALLVNPLAAYAMSRYKMPSAYKILLFMLCTMAFPPMVTSIPNFLMLRQLGLLNTFAALILPGLANGYSIFLLKGFFDAQPQELYESAQLDGASEWVLFWQIAMSLSKPILAVIALQAFNLAYSNFMFAFVVCQDEKMWTLMVWLYQLQQKTGQSVMYASLIIAAIPTFLIFLFCQNIIMRGIVVPSEK